MKNGKYFEMIVLLTVFAVAFAGIMTVSAQETEIADDFSLSEIPSLPLKDMGEMNRSVISRSDMVEIKDDGVGIITSEGLGIAYTLPDFQVYVLTQDLIRQIDLYRSFYDDPIGAVSQFVSNGIHLNVYDPEYKVDAFVSVRENQWASAFPDSKDLSDEEAGELMDFFLRKGFGKARDTAFGKIGGNSWFIFDCSDTDGYVHMFASVAGYQVNVVYTAETDEQVKRGLEMINCLTVVQYNG